MSAIKNGRFVISLDFELFWGLRDHLTIKEYEENIIGVRTVIPRLLTIFKKYQIKATFATVGFLFFSDKLELIRSVPERLPNYNDKNLSPYLGYFDEIGESEDQDPYHFGTKLIEQIKQHPMHEISSHTFSHYYCLEPGQTKEDFESDLQTALNLANKHLLKSRSIVFPRNQYNEDYLEVCKKNNVICFRGNESAWFYNSKNSSEYNSFFRKAARLIDTYINISGHNCYSDNDVISGDMINIPSSRFLRPFSNKLKAIERFKLYRIKNSMTYAAKNNLTYHLWWHPHNFGINQDENFLFLNKILEHYKKLNSEYNFNSYTMTEIANELTDG
jgi:hypothetical protein